MKSCRICGSTQLYAFLDLGMQPLANAVLAQEQFVDERFYPLSLQFCKNCGLVQLKDTVSSDVLFREYAYFSGKASEDWRQHLADLAKKLEDEFSACSTDLIVDIGSNDGTLLRNFHRNVIGFDPAVNVAKEAIANGVQTIIDYFNVENVMDLVRLQGKAKIVTSTNSFAHIPDLYEVMSALKLLLADDGVFVAEVPHFLQLFKHHEFDTIYHEHVFYYLTKPLAQMSDLFKIPLFRIEKLSTHGGSVRLYFGKNRTTEPSVEEVFQEEEGCGLYEPATYNLFSKHVRRLQMDLIKLLQSLKSERRKIVGYGHPAKASTLLNSCKIGPEIIDYVTDTTPYKQGKFSPGMHIPIASPDKFHNDNPDYAIMFAWNYKDEILRKEQKFLQRGGKFIIPIPKVEVIP